MNLEARINAFTRLGTILHGGNHPVLTKAMTNASKYNGWFTIENVEFAVSSLGEMLREEKIRIWLEKYPTIKSIVDSPARIAVIMAGNIPLVGFHDFVCVLISGNILVAKLSSDDNILLPALTKILIEIEPGFKDKVYFTEQKLGKSSELSAFIGTGSNNSARYFEYYFGKYPHIIRKNRNSVAILDGNENPSDLKDLGKDIFQYFGMGCRNVSKIYVPEDYDLDRFFSGIVDFGEVINHNKYYNNHQYYRTIYLLNNEKFLDNNFLMLKKTASKSPKEKEIIASPVATLYYEYYKGKNELFEKILNAKEQIQCIVSNNALPAPLEILRVRPGQTQSPELWDYADGIDTINFLLKLQPQTPKRR